MKRNYDARGMRAPQTEKRQGETCGIKKYAGKTLQEELNLVRETGAQLATMGAGFYTKRSDGVPEDTDIRSDKFERLRNSKNSLDAETIAKRSGNSAPETAPTETEATENSIA